MRVLTSIVLLILAGISIAHADVDVYDQNRQPKGYIDKNGNIYDKNRQPKGHIDKNGNIYDENRQPKGRIEKNWNN